MAKIGKKIVNLAEIPVIYEVVEPNRFVRSCIHCSGQSCWCIMGLMDDSKDTEIELNLEALISFGYFVRKNPDIVMRQNYLKWKEIYKPFKKTK